MDLGRIMQINDGALDDFVVRNVEVNAVVRAQPRRAPVDLHHFAVGIAHL